MKTGNEICKGETHPLLVSAGYSKELERKEKWYLASDIDKRIVFHNNYNSVPSSLVFDYPKFKSLLSVFFTQDGNKAINIDTYNGWLHEFCFTNLDKDFEEMIKQ